MKKDHRGLNPASTITAGNGAATGVILTATSSRSAKILKSPSTGSTTVVNLASDKQEDVRTSLVLTCRSKRSYSFGVGRAGLQPRRRDQASPRGFSP